MKLFKKEKKDAVCSVDGWKLSAPGLKFRVKEFIFQFDSGEKYTFIAQLDMKSVEEGYTVDHCGYDESGVNLKNGSTEYWVNLRRTGFETLKEAEEFCKTIKPKLNKQQIKIHYL